MVYVKYNEYSKQTNNKSVIPDKVGYVWYSITIIVSWHVL